MNYRNKIVLVTGASSGIGRRLAQSFAGQGATVVVSGRNRDALEHTAKLMAADGADGTVITADVTNPAEVAHLVEEIVRRFGRLDVAVNNAGVLATGPIAEFADDDWTRLFDVNTTGVFTSMKYEIAAMRSNGGGAIVNIGSNVGAHARVPGLGAYGASKAAVSAMSRAAALEYIQDGIRINVVSPGASDTTMSLRPGETEADRAVRLRDESPIGRVGELDEIASTVLWLASDEAAYVVGHDLVVDGGAAA